mgnify:CR=1 FL=1
MAIEQTAETGHDITLATHLAKNFDGYGEELKAHVRDFVIESMSRPGGGYRRFNIDRLGDFVEEETDLYLEVTVTKCFGVSGYYIGYYIDVDMDARVVFDRYTPREGVGDYYEQDEQELVVQLEAQLDRTLESFKSIGECALAEMLHEMETGEVIA